MSRSVPPATDSTAFCRRYLAAIAGNGFHAFPIPPAQKRTHWSGWTVWCRIPPRPDQVARWIDKHGRYGLALACGHACLAIDIDEEDGGRAGDLHALATALLGATPLVRIGRAPRRVLVYRVAEAPIPSRRISPAVELIGDRRYVLAHGIHPQLGQPYIWPECAPESLPLAELPAPDAAALANFAEAVAGFYDLPTPSATAPLVVAGGQNGQQGEYDRPRISIARPDARWVLDGRGWVTDGRDAFLTAQVYGAFASGLDSAEAIAATAFERFAAGADLARPKRGGNRRWVHANALAKARALLASSKPRPALRGGMPGIDTRTGLWTPPHKEAFHHAVNAAGAAGGLSPAAVAVSAAMLSYVQGDGSAFASVATLAGRLGLAPDTVKRARRALLNAGFWTAEKVRGGRGHLAHYRPAVTVLAGGPSPNQPPEPANGDRSVHPNNQGGGIHHPPGRAPTDLSSPKRTRVSHEYEV